MASYELTWRMDSTSDTPEEQLGARTRPDAVNELLSEIGVEDDVTYQPQRRHLSGDPQPFFEVCSLVIDNVESLIIIYQYIRNRQDSEAVTADEVEDLIKEELAKRDREE